MAKFDYSEQSITLVKAIDLTIKALTKFPPRGFNKDQLTRFINSYEQFKHSVLSPESKYRNSKSLSVIQNDVFTYFQEGSGDAINYFWEQVKQQNLPYRRENKLVKILKRGKIKGQHEYDFIIDVLVPYQQEGLLNEQDITKINQMITSFGEDRKDQN